MGNRNKTKFWKEEWHELGNMELFFADTYNLFLTTKDHSRDLDHTRLEFTISGDNS